MFQKLDSTSLVQSVKLTTHFEFNSIIEEELSKMSGTSTPIKLKDIDPDEQHSTTPV